MGGSIKAPLGGSGNFDSGRTILRGNQKIQEDMREPWFPVIEVGRRKSNVRPDLTDESIIEIIISIHGILIMRDDYGPSKQREFLLDVLIPAITGSP